MCRLRRVIELARWRALTDKQWGELVQLAEMRQWLHTGENGKVTMQRAAEWCKAIGLGWGEQEWRAIDQLKGFALERSIVRSRLLWAEFATDERYAGALRSERTTNGLFRSEADDLTRARGGMRKPQLLDAVDPWGDLDVPNYRIVRRITGGALAVQEFSASDPTEVALVDCLLEVSRKTGCYVGDAYLLTFTGRNENIFANHFRMVKAEPSSLTHLELSLDLGLGYEEVGDLYRRIKMHLVGKTRATQDKMLNLLSFTSQLPIGTTDDEQRLAWNDHCEEIGKGSKSKDGGRKPKDDWTYTDGDAKYFRRDRDAAVRNVMDPFGNPEEEK